MSAYHEALPHGAGLIMLSLAYFGWLAEHHVCDDRLVDLARFLGREDASPAGGVPGGWLPFRKPAGWTG